MEHPIFQIELASVIDRSGKPTVSKNTFPVGQSIYVTFRIKPETLPTKIQVDWYQSNQLYSDISLILDHTSEYGYASVIFTHAGDCSVSLFYTNEKNESVPIITLPFIVS